MSKRYVVDTNVPIVANGGDAYQSIGSRIPSNECKLSAVIFLERVIKSGVVVLDNAGEIQSEYHRYLNPRGQPGVGDRFYQLVVNSAPRRIERVSLTKVNDEFDDFPKDQALSTFDRSDRKFVALALKANATIANAIDSDWLEHRSELVKNGVMIKFICSMNSSRWFA